MSEDDSAFMKLFAETPSESGKNELAKPDGMNTLRILLLYAGGVLGVEFLPALLSTDWIAIAGPRWGYLIATGLGLVSAAGMDIFRRWKTDYAPDKPAQPAKPNTTTNPYNGV